MIESAPEKKEKVIFRLKKDKKVLLMYIDTPSPTCTLALIIGYKVDTMLITVTIFHMFDKMSK